MDTCNRKIRLTGASTLLLVVATATLASCQDKKTDKRPSLKFSDSGDVWSLTFTCQKMIESSLPDGDNYNEDPKEMLKELKTELANKDRPAPNDIHGLLRRHYIKRLVSYSEPDPRNACNGIFLHEFLEMTSMCGDDKRFKRYADFLNHYAAEKFRPCAVELIQSYDLKLDQKLEELLDRFEEFFKAALGIEDTELNKNDLYKRLMDVDLATELDVHAMLKVASKHHKQDKKWLILDNSLKNLLGFFHKQCTDFLRRALLEASFINAAKSLEAIKQEELTPKFLLIYRHTRLCGQFLNQENGVIKDSWGAQLKGASNFFKLW